MKLKRLISSCKVLGVHGSLETEINFVTNDSRKVVPGSLFVAVSGCGNDGRAYIDAAIAAGASAIVCEGVCPDFEGTGISVESSSEAVALIADCFYGHPSGKLNLVGITGTNGKTTTVTLLYNMFRSLGYECGLLSTIANYVGGRRSETANTTSDPMTINRLLAEMVDAGCEYCFMEVSSIGIEQNRVKGLEFKIGIFSNLTHDHLDYHGSFAEYLRCKKRFFDELPEDSYAIVNIDDKNGRVMVQNTKAELVTYSCRSIADHKCRIMEQSFDGMLLNIDGTEVWTRLIGIHNAYNLLALYCCAMCLSVDSHEALLAISKLESASGRLENIRGPRGLNVIIDYAHTPDALENVLGTLRKIAPKRKLVCLFGCGGDRDKSKRPEMAAIAEKYADRIVLSSDNSRSEKTKDIIEDIKQGLSQEGLKKTICISDREEAIKASILFAEEGSTILLAGKGHETYQITGGQKVHFDEREIVNRIFETII